MELLTWTLVDAQWAISVLHVRIRHLPEQSCTVDVLRWTVVLTQVVIIKVPARLSRYNTFQLHWTQNSDNVYKHQVTNSNKSYYTHYTCFKQSLIATLQWLEMICYKLLNKYSPRQTIFFLNSNTVQILFAYARYITCWLPCKTTKSIITKHNDDSIWLSIARLIQISLYRLSVTWWKQPHVLYDYANDVIINIM